MLVRLGRGRLINLEQIRYVQFSEDEKGEWRAEVHWADASAKSLVLPDRMARGLYEWVIFEDQFEFIPPAD